MLEKTYRTYIYTDRATNRILFVKKSVEIDFTFVHKDIVSHQITTQNKLPKINSFDFSFEALEGLKKTSSAEGGELERLNLLKSKIEVILLMKTNLFLMKRDIFNSFKDSVLASAPLQEKHFYRYWKFVRLEKSILLKRVKSFYLDFEEKISGCTDSEAVRSVYQNLISNLNLGVYSITNRERKKIGISEN